MEFYKGRGEHNIVTLEAMIVDREDKIRELEAKLTESTKLLDAKGEWIKDLEGRLSQLPTVEGYKIQTSKLAIAIEALELIAMDNIYVGENGWKDEHFLNVKHATEALEKIKQ